MNIMLTWPVSNDVIQLDETTTAAEPVFFSLTSGQFYSYLDHESHSQILSFYATASGHFMSENSSEFSCYHNSLLISPGSVTKINHGDIIQAGHYQFAVQLYSMNGDLASLVLEEYDTSAFDDKDGSNQLFEDNNLLNQGDYFTNYLSNINETLLSEADPDVLKHLEYEYKRYLQWGEQKTAFGHNAVSENIKIFSRDEYIENIFDSVKGKTVTECMFPESNLANRILNELEEVNELEADDDTPYKDLLYVLAPSHIIKNQRKGNYSLLLQDIVKSGLDSRI